ncbi:MAG: CoA transferase, partial [Candidatus Kapaibacteriota bacterium]
DVALLDSIMPLMGWVVANLMLGGQQPELLGNDNFTAAPSGTFKTQDGYINIAANKQEQWETLADLLGLSHLKEDPRFKERDIRKKNRFELNPLIEEKLMEKPTKYWVELLNNNDIPAGEILSLEDALNQPQIQVRNTFSTLNVEGIGPIKVFNLTAKFEKTPGFAETPPPKLSQHTEEVLSLIGITKEEIETLRKEGVV